MFDNTRWLFRTPLLVAMLFQMSNMFNASQATTVTIASSPDSINYIGTDLDGNFVICLNNNETRRYPPDFSSYASINIGEQIMEYSSHQSSQLWSLANGTTLDVSSRVSFFLDTTYSKSWIYEYYSTTELLMMDFATQTIFAKFIIPARVNGVTVGLLWGIGYYYAFFLNQHHSLGATPSLGSQTLGAVQLSVAITDLPGTDSVNVQAKFLVAKATEIQIVTVATRMSFDHGLNHFRNTETTLDEVSAHTLGTSAGMVYNLVEKAGDYIYIQNYFNSVRLMYHIPTNTFVDMSTLPSQVSYKFYQLGGEYFIIQAHSIIKLACVSASCVYMQDVATLGFGTHRMAFTSTHSALYTMGQGTVQVNDIIATENTSTANSSTKGNTKTVSLFESELLSNFVDQLGQTLANTVSVPGARRIASPLFYFFGIFVDLFLYQFQDRQYSSTMLRLFEQINAIEYQKWSLLNYSTVLGWFNTNVTEFNQLLNYQQQYTIHRYQVSDHPAAGSEALLPNSQNFFVVAVPACIVVFLLLRSIFWALFNHPASRIFRKFYFLSFLFLLLFDGNIEQFSFYMVTEWKNIFAFTLPQKLLKVFVLFFGWVLVMGSAGLYFISYALYKKLNHYLMDNNRNQIRGQVMLIIQFGLKNFYLGFLHSVLRDLPYTYAMTILLTSEVLFLLMFVVAIAFGVYKELSKIWVLVLLNLTKVMLVGTIFADYSYPGMAQTQKVQQGLIFLTVVFFCCGIVVESISLFIQLLVAIRRRLCPQVKSNTADIQQQEYGAEQHETEQYNDSSSKEKRTSGIKEEKRTERDPSDIKQISNSHGLRGWDSLGRGEAGRNQMKKEISLQKGNQSKKKQVDWLDSTQKPLCLQEREQTSPMKGRRSNTDMGQGVQQLKIKSGSRHVASKKGSQLVQINSS